MSLYQQNQILNDSQGGDHVITTLNSNQNMVVDGSGNITTSATPVGGGATTVGVVNQTATANAADITGTVLTMHYGSSTNPGIAHIRSTIATNMAAGQNAYPQYSTIGVQNTAYGGSALGVLGTMVAGANNNAAFGYTALNGITSGSSNTALGSQAGTFLTTGIQNTFTGCTAGRQALSGNSNCAYGFGSMNALNSTGSGNCFYGEFSGYNMLSGNFNAGFGRSSLGTLTSGVRNCGVGHSAGSNGTTGSDNLYLGYNTSLAAAGDSSCIVLGSNTVGNGSNTTTINSNYISAAVGTSFLKYDLGTGLVSRDVSSIRYKRITSSNPPVADHCHRLLDLQPRAYTLYSEDDKPVEQRNNRIGYIAEEVEAIKGPLNNPVFNGLLIYTMVDDPDAPPITETREEFVQVDDSLVSQSVEVEVPSKKRVVESINYAGFVVPIVELLKKQQQQIDALTARLNTAGIP